MTDREAIRLHLGRLVSRIDDSDVAALFEALGKAQNGPPDGTADGSIGAAEWEACAKAANALSSGARLAHRALGT